MTNILSAKGSANLPKLDTKCRRRAICPSAKSVIEATAKMIAPTNCVTGITVPKQVTSPHSSGKSKTSINSGIKKILITVNLLGKFILNILPYPFLTLTTTRLTELA